MPIHIAVAAGMVGTVTAADMTAENIQTFKTFAFYVPLALIVLSLLVFAFAVKIDEKMRAYRRRTGGTAGFGRSVTGGIGGTGR